MPAVQKSKTAWAYFWCLLLVLSRGYEVDVNLHRLEELGAVVAHGWVQGEGEGRGAVRQSETEWDRVRRSGYVGGWSGIDE